jgi:hypothetical protein
MGDGMKMNKPDVYEEITDSNSALVAFIIRADYTAPKTKFFTPETSPEQFAYFLRPKDEEVEPHIHNMVKREFTAQTQEIIFMRSGTMQADIFDNDQKLIRSLVLHPGDILFQISGGHGFKMLDEVQMFVVKQGPYSGVENDKTHFIAK